MYICAFSRCQVLLDKMNLSNHVQKGAAGVCGCVAYFPGKIRVLLIPINPFDGNHLSVTLAYWTETGLQRKTRNLRNNLSAEPILLCLPSVSVSI